MSSYPVVSTPSSLRGPSGVTTLLKSATAVPGCCGAGVCCGFPLVRFRRRRGGGLRRGRRVLDRVGFLGQDRADELDADRTCESSPFAPRRRRCVPSRHRSYAAPTGLGSNRAARRRMRPRRREHAVDLRVHRVPTTASVAAPVSGSADVSRQQAAGKRAEIAKPWCFCGAGVAATAAGLASAATIGLEVARRRRRGPADDHPHDLVVLQPGGRRGVRQRRQ